MLPVLPVIAATEKEKLKPMDKRLIIPGLVAALAILFISILVTYATSIASPVVIFTFSAGGIMIISALVGIVFFKEKINLNGWIGIVLGIISMIFLKVFEI
jgi:multidrug transporter EmrE-like cation transporter